MDVGRAGGLLAEDLNSIRGDTMKTWLVNLMWDALEIFCRRAHDWAFDPNRSARIRMKHRKRWWAYVLRSQKTMNVGDDMRAQWWKIQFGFTTPPDAAVARGDLEPYRTH